MEMIKFFRFGEIIKDIKLTSIRLGDCECGGSILLSAKIELDKPIVYDHKVCYSIVVWVKKEMEKEYSFDTGNGYYTPIYNGSRLFSQPIIDRIESLLRTRKTYCNLIK